MDLGFAFVVLIIELMAPAHTKYIQATPPAHDPSFYENLLLKLTLSPLLESTTYHQHKDILRLNVCGLYLYFFREVLILSVSVPV